MIRVPIFFLLRLAVETEVVSSLVRRLHGFTCSALTVRPLPELVLYVSAKLAWLMAKATSTSGRDKAMERLRHLATVWAHGLMNFLVVKNNNDKLSPACGFNRLKGESGMFVQTLP